MAVQAPQPRSVDTGTYTSNVHDWGAADAEPVLLLHGSGPGANAWSNWQFAIPALSGRRRCIAADLVGFGRSGHPADRPGDVREWMDLWVGQMLELMDHLEIERAQVVGNSMGGAVALHLLDRAPERFDRAVLMGPAGPPHAIREQLDRVWGFYDDPTTDNMAQLLEWFAWDTAIVGDDLKAIAETRLEGALNPDVRASFEAMFPAPRQQHVDRLALAEDAWGRIENRVLLLHGRDDLIVPLETSLFLLEHLPNVELHVFGKCRHWLMVEYRDEFNRLVEQFFDGDI
jgi:2-hydroxymuconate-semialdehyde hydrolase